jgi:hypothetical protein
MSQFNQGNGQSPEHHGFPTTILNRPVRVTYKVAGNPDNLTESVVPIPLDQDCVEKLAKLARQSNRDTATETE